MLVMRAHHLTVRITPWVFALALLLKAAVPMLAATAAQVQGKALAEVCTVYGVATVAADAADPAGHEGGTTHATEHCGLAGWVAMAAPALPTAAVPACLTTVGARPVAHHPQRHDACAAWAARLAHAPPRAA